MTATTAIPEAVLTGFARIIGKRVDFHSSGMAAIILIKKDSLVSINQIQIKRAKSVNVTFPNQRLKQRTTTYSTNFGWCDIFNFFEILERIPFKLISFFLSLKGSELITPETHWITFYLFDQFIDYFR
jgi:hypothetical protein